MEGFTMVFLGEEADRRSADGGPPPHRAGFGPTTVGPDDPRYAELVVGFNRRWHARPDSVRLVGSTEQVADAVREAVRTGKRLSVRSGGHSYADFVYNAETELIIDLSLMREIGYDPRRRAFAVQSGAQLGEIYEVLFRGWGVTLPGGVCPTVGIAGHATGGGHGLLSRQHGYVCDQIEAVEVVVTDGCTVRTVVASRSDSGALGDLWWACTGGGGGSFGIITKFWFRKPDATGSDPGEQLPRPPREVLISTVFAGWDQLDRTGFANLLRNQCQWYVDHSEPGDPGEALCGLLFAQHVSSGAIGMLTQVDATVPNADELLDEYLSAVTAGTGIEGPFPRRRLPWMASTETLDTSNPTVMTNATLRGSTKHAFLRKPFTDEQLDVIYESLTRPDYANSMPGSSMLQLGAMAGGRMNEPAPGDTALVQRRSALVAIFESFWVDEAQDDQHLGWVREFYHRTFAATGGYPVPGERYEGCNINAPDPDVLDPAFNRTGLPWHSFYFGGNYPRLQRIKARWDPADVFRHSMSVRTC
ncbi:FAD-binding protein [Saccharopolyspora sp. NPDC047091]|uniref:FAD-dependent oxidoreductase n=1 Tax=Saccharopolyspora sp. NPDC047091 TaxID=3155924 RepID=UPI00340F97BF